MGYPLRIYKHKKISCENRKNKEKSKNSTQQFPCRENSPCKFR
uniref:Uncharacterized protein n=1 Tax=Anguilla anguilla TaxID=7936 RepID=A0A0E9WFI8_ANGAN